jgi:membrane associated rhomboid family serine protease
VRTPVAFCYVVPVAEDDADDGLRRRWATLALLGLNGSVFAAMLLAGASPWYTGWVAIAAGGVEPSRVWEGEVWRFLTACFVHLGIWHVALNGWCLWQLGPTLERFIGGSRTLLIYLSTGVFGFALSIALRAVPTAGASGAVFGITGALLAVALMLRRHQLELGRMLLGALVPFVGATLVLGFLVPGIDNTAHVGGLLFGILVGYGLTAGDAALFEGRTAAQPAAPSVATRMRGPAALVGAAVVFIAITAYGARPVLSPRYHAVAGLRDLAMRRGTPSASPIAPTGGPAAKLPLALNDAKAHAVSAARLGAEDASTFILLGRIRIESSALGPAGDADRDEGLRLVREGVKRLEGDDVTEQFLAAMAALSLGGGTEELPFSDLRTVDALCDAALLEHEMRDPGKPAAQLKNACAWLWLKAPDPATRDPARALVLARAAVADSEGVHASIVHTLAEALSQNGQALEGLAHLEKLAAAGRADELPGGASFLMAERQRLKRLVDPRESAFRVGSP